MNKPVLNKKAAFGVHTFISLLLTDFFSRMLGVSFFGLLCLVIPVAGGFVLLLLDQTEKPTALQK